MLGGYQIINLTKLDLTIGTSQVSITDSEILNQLRDLREHIEDNYNFAIPLNRKLKPVLLRLRDKKNGEKQEVSVWANLSIITNNKTFKIEALVDSVSMKAIQIEVVFQQLTDDDGNPYWDIKTAKYLYTENINIEGGTVEADVLMENIKDEDGHIRFIEDEIVVPDTASGFTKVYGKWSLSGSHLMIVLCVSITNDTTFSSQTIGAIELPEWIMNKIYPIYTDTIVPYTTFKAFKDDGTTMQNVDVRLAKGVNQLALIMYSNTMTDDRIVRISFDLLIDNE